MSDDSLARRGEESQTEWEMAGKTVNDATMDDIRQRYEVHDRIVKDPKWDGKAVKSEGWEMFQEIRRLRMMVAMADRLYASVHAHFQAASDREYNEEFGHKGPHLAGLPLRSTEPLNSPDRTYVYWRHRLSDDYPTLPDAGIALGQR